MLLRVNRGVAISAVVPGAVPYNKLPGAAPAWGRVGSDQQHPPRDLDHVGQLLDRVRPGEPVHFVLLRVVPHGKDRVAVRVDMTLTLTKYIFFLFLSRSSTWTISSVGFRLERGAL